MKNVFNRVFACIATGALLLGGCAAIPPEQQISVGYLAPIKNTPAKKFLLKEDVNVSFKQKAGGAIIKFTTTTNLTLQAGEYVEIARGSGGTYYRHAGKGLKAMELGMASYTLGGIKMPDNSSGQWLAWIYFNEVRFSGGVMETRSSTSKTHEFSIENLATKSIEL